MFWIAAALSTLSVLATGWIAIGLLKQVRGELRLYLRWRRKQRQQRSRRYLASDPPTETRWGTTESVRLVKDGDPFSNDMRTGP